MGNSSGHQIPKRLKLTYFDVRVRGEPIRMTLVYAGLPFEDVRVKPPFDPTSEWKDIKDTTPWGQLPIFEADGQVLGQSVAIARYVAKLAGIYGKTALEQAKYDAITDSCDDALWLFAPYYLFETDETKKEEKAKNIRTKIPVLTKQLEAILGKDNFFGGNKLSYADLQFYNMWECYKIGGFEHLFKDSAALLALVNRIQNIPSLKKYLENRKHTKV